MSGITNVGSNPNVAANAIRSPFDGNPTSEDAIRQPGHAYSIMELHTLIARYEKENQRLEKEYTATLEKSAGLLKEYADLKTAQDLYNKLCAVKMESIGENLKGLFNEGATDKTEKVMQYIMQTLVEEDQDAETKVEEVIEGISKMIKEDL